MKLGFLMSHGRENSVTDKVTGKKWVYLVRNTLHRWSVGHFREWEKTVNRAWLVFIWELKNKHTNKQTNNLFPDSSAGKELPVMQEFSSVQLLSRVILFATPWTAACQAFQSITNSWSSLKLISIESVMPSNHLILCCPLLLLPPIPPSVRVFSNHHQ